MQKAIRILMDEHRVIERVLGALETYAAEVRGGLSVERPSVSRFATFFRDFADAAHHGKEEDILFLEMARKGFPTAGGPLAVMLAEHAEGRRAVAALRAVGGGSGPVPALERQTLLAAADGYVPLLRAHIQKEDNILYPMSERVISGPEFDDMLRTFEAFQASLTGDRAPEHLLRLAETLEKDFPPDAGRTAAATMAGGCWSRD